MPFSSGEYIEIFNKSYEDSPEEKIESIGSNGVIGYRVKTIKSGKMLESEIYPLWRNRADVSKAKKLNETRGAQKNLNDKNAKKNIIRKVNANFTEEDLIIDLTYKGKPPNEQQARKDIQNYIRRLKDYRKKTGLSELKYIYVIEYEEDGSKKRIHHHMLINAMDRDVAEKLWGKGYSNSRRLQPNEFGLEGIARYITKDPKGTKRWCASRNLDKPKVTVADHKITKRQADKIAKNEHKAHEVFEKIYKGYKFNDLKIAYSDFVPGAYLYARMRKDDLHAKRGRESNKYKSASG